MIFQISKEKNSNWISRPVQLEQDLRVKDDYLHKLRLIPDTIKSEVAIFHLNNHIVNKEGRVRFEVELLRNNKTPKGGNARSFPALLVSHRSGGSKVIIEK